MTDDLRALLAAIVADPADDTARLAYADCLEEQGNSARAQFIRLQIEAEWLHPDSNARAALEDQAHALLAEHWIDWWGEVCTAVGLPVPAPKPSGMIGRFARRVGLGTPAGTPYKPSDLSRFSIAHRPAPPYHFSSWGRTTFRRGFPDSVGLSPELPTGRHFLSLWPATSPLAELILDPYSEEVAGVLRDGAHPSTLRSLSFVDYEPAVVLGTLDSPHLTRLEELTVNVPVGEPGAELFADELARLLSSPRARQLKRLSLPVWRDAAAEAMADAENLAGLEALEVLVMPGDRRPADPDPRLATLARSPHLAGLTELTVREAVSGSAIEAAIRNPTWKRLRKLDLEVAFWRDRFDAFDGPDGLPELEELRLLELPSEASRYLARSPLLKRLRHFAVRWNNDPVELDGRALADAFDPDRLETFALGRGGATADVVEPLRAKFGERLRLVN